MTTATAVETTTTMETAAAEGTGNSTAATISIATTTVIPTAVAIATVVAAETDADADAVTVVAIGITVGVAIAIRVVGIRCGSVGNRRRSSVGAVGITITATIIGRRSGLPIVVCLLTVSLVRLAVALIRGCVGVVCRGSGALNGSSLCLCVIGRIGARRVRALR